jgi:choline kinase
MDAIIVAAGGGSRMLPLTAETHKCLLPVDGRPLIDYSLDTLKDHGIKRISVVTGHCRDQVQDAIRSRVDRFVVNPFYKISNNMASLWFAHECVEDDFLYLHADLLYHPEILTKVLNQAFSFGSICVEEKTTFSGEEMKVGLEGDHLVLGKELSDAQAFGEFIGIAAFKRDRFAVFFDLMTKILLNDGYNSYFAQAIASVSHDYHVDVVSFTGLPWIEIDTEADLEKARTETFRRIYQQRPA